MESSSVREGQKLAGLAQKGGERGSLLDQNSLNRQEGGCAWPWPVASEGDGPSPEVTIRDG